MHLSLPINSNLDSQPEALNCEAWDTNPVDGILFHLLPSYQMINSVTAVMSPEAQGSTPQLSLTEPGFRNSPLIGREERLALVH